MGLIAKYPDRVEIIPDLIETALEEMQHFKEVYDIMRERKVELTHKIKEDIYIKSC